MNSYFYSKRLKNVYTFDNRQNGNMGAGYFYGKTLTKPKILIPSFIKRDLSIYLLYSNGTDSSVLQTITNKVSSIKGYNLGFEKKLANNNYTQIINKIKQDTNNKILIIDNKLNINLDNLGIPFKICDLTDLNETLYTYIYNNLFSLIEKKYIIN